MQNRQAAATSRIKKKNYSKELEAKVDFLTQANMKLQCQVATLLEQNMRLQEQASPSVSPSLSFSEFATLESAELVLPQQSEVADLEMENKVNQGLSLMLLGILSWVIARSGHSLQSSPSPFWNERLLERRRFLQVFCVLDLLSKEMFYI